MIDGGETIVKKVRDEEKVLLNVAPKETETHSTGPEKGKGGKSKPKGNGKGT